MSVAPAAAQTTATLKVKPATLTFTYTIGDAKFPAAQAITIAGTAGAAFTATRSGGLWITVSPESGVLPGSVKAAVNPTTLTLGTYTGTIAITSGGETTTIPVTLTVKSPPSSLAASPATLEATYVRGQALPSAATIGLVTSDGLLPFTAKAAGGSWLSVTPGSGAVFPAFPTNLTVSYSPVGLAPGNYSGTITVAAPAAANKSVTIKVTLTVQAGVPTLTSLWPYRITQGAPDTIMTVTGTNFATDTVVRAGGIDLATTFAGPNVVTALLPGNLLKVPGPIAVIARNPGTGGGDSGDRTFTVLSSTPTLASVVNAASFKSGAVAPGEMIVLFGTGLGPDALTTFAPPAANTAIATTLSGTRVLINGIAAPIIYTSATQVAALTPYGVSGQTSTPVVVEYKSAQTAPMPVTVAAASPAIFTAAGTGTGQAVAFNYDVGSGEYTLNSERAPAQVGSIIVFFATGEGVTNPLSVDGQIVTTPASGPSPSVAVHIGGSDSEVLYSGGVVGLATSIMQINARVPQIKGSKETSLKVLVNGIGSPDPVTINVK